MKKGGKGVDKAAKRVVKRLIEDSLLKRVPLSEISPPLPLSDRTLFTSTGPTNQITAADVRRQFETNLNKLRSWLTNLRTTTGFTTPKNVGKQQSSSLGSIRAVSGTHIENKDLFWFQRNLENFQVARPRVLKPQLLLAPAGDWADPNAAGFLNADIVKNLLDCKDVVERIRKGELQDLSLTALGLTEALRDKGRDPGGNPEPVSWVEEGIKEGSRLLVLVHGMQSKIPLKDIDASSTVVRTFDRIEDAYDTDFIRDFVAWANTWRTGAAPLAIGRPHKVELAFTPYAASAASENIKKERK